MYSIMLTAMLLIFFFTVYSGYAVGIFESSYMFFRNVIAFLLAFTLFPLGTSVIVKVVPLFRDYPAPQYIRVILYAAVFIILIGVSDQMRFQYLFSSIDITINKYADRIVGAGIGLLNGVMISGFVLILWALLPFVGYIPGDFGYFNAERLPVDSGAVLLRTYSHISRRMGGEDFYWKAPEGVEMPVEEQETLSVGWVEIYRRPADLCSGELKEAVGRDSKASNDG